MNLKSRIIFIFIFIVSSIYAQEEFLFNSYGLCASKSYNFKNNDNESMGLSFRSKKGFIGGFTWGNNEGLSNKAFYLGVIPDLGNKLGGLKGICSVNYGDIDGYNFFGGTFGFTDVFLSKSNFSFSLGSVLNFTKFKESQVGNNNELQTSLSINYSQTFFSRSSPVYPVIGISRVYSLNEHKNKSLFFNLGLNINLSKIF